MHAKLVVVNIAIACLLTFFKPHEIQAGFLVIKETGITTAQTQLDYNHSYFWKFKYTGSNALTFDPILSILTLKRGPQTNQSAVLKLWSADSNSSNQILMGTAELLPANASQQFTARTFTLISGTQTSLPSYFNLSLTSQAALGGNSDPQSQSWFIKDPANTAFSFENEFGQAVAGFEYLGYGLGDGGSGSGSGSGGSSAPEPGTFGFLLLGLSLLTARGRNRNRAVA